MTNRNGQGRTPVVSAPEFAFSKGGVIPQTGTILAAAPPMIGGVVAGGFDKGSWRTLNLDTLRQLWRLSERMSGSVIGKLDTRDTVTATIPIASAVGATATATLTVPAGELWELTAVQIVDPAGAALEIITVNFRISSFPDDAVTPSALGKLFWAVDKGVVAGAVYTNEFWEIAPFADLENMPMPLRLAAGTTITLIATVTGAVTAAARSATLTPYGYKVAPLGD